MNPSPNRDREELSEELKRKFREALNSPLKNPHCSECPGARGFVPVVEFLIDNWTQAIEKIDIATQVMEDFIETFKMLEIRDYQARMLGDDPR